MPESKPSDTPRHGPPAFRRQGGFARRRRSPAERNCRLAFVFPGQGSQFVGMGQKLAQAYPSAAQLFAQADELLGFSLSRLCFAGPHDELRRTANAQPALLTCSLAVLRVLEENGLRPDIVAGHSLGEFSAWVAAGALDFAAALLLVRKRGELMEQAARNHPGSMLAVLGVEPKLLRRMMERIRGGVLVIANLNCPGQTVVSGEEALLRELRERVLQEGARAVPLRVSGAFHSPLMRESAEQFKQEIGRLQISPARIAVVTNVGARPTRAPEAVREAMTAQMTSPVQWEDSVRKLAQYGVTTFVEVGPGEVLCGLLKRTLGESARILPTGEPENLQEVIASLKQKSETLETQAQPEATAAGPAAPEENVER